MAAEGTIFIPENADVKLLGISGLTFFYQCTSTETEIKGVFCEGVDLDPEMPIKNLLEFKEKLKLSVLKAHGETAELPISVVELVAVEEPKLGEWRPFSFRRFHM